MTSKTPKKAAPVKKAAPAKKAIVPQVEPKAAPKKAVFVKRAPTKTKTKDEKARLAAAEAAKKTRHINFAKAIAQEMKRTAKARDEQRQQEAESAGVKLARRPTARTAGAKSFSAFDLAAFKKRLLAARQNALKGVDAMKATGFNETGDREADGGDGSNQTLRLQALGQMGNINRTLQQIEEALRRVEDGSYGVCTVCGQLIRKPRLLNQPFVLTCMECQSEMERNVDK